MATPTYPGVYVEEVSSGVRPIGAVGTSTAAFVGVAEMGPTDDAHRVTNWTEYLRLYGSFVKNGYLAEGVFQFFNNGGRQCYVLRVTPDDAQPAALRVENRVGDNGVEFSAKSPGSWGNTLVLTIEDGKPAASDLFRISVRRQEDPSLLPPDFGERPPLEVHDQLSMNPEAPNFVERVLASRSELITAKVLASNDALDPGAHVGGPGPQLPLGDKREFQINVDADGFQTVDLPAEAAASDKLEDVATAIEDAVKGLEKQKASTPDEAFSAFTCKAQGDGDAAHLVLNSGTRTAQSSVVVQRADTDNATGLLKIGKNDGGVSRFAFAARRPQLAEALQLGDAVAGDLTKGTDGTGKLSVTDFENAFHKLDNKTDFSLLAVPGESAAEVFSAGVNYCENRPLRDVFFIGETADHDLTPADAEDFWNGITKKNSYGAVYFPWIKAADPSGRSSEPVLLPPSGYVAGLYARTDADRGVWKAPAGTGASLGGAVGLGVELSDVQHGQLNPLGVNVIRRFAGSGIVSFGARTVSGPESAEWKYVSVRRLGIMLRVSIYYGIQWAVFEPNDELLWSQLRLNIRTFMMNLFRQGAFQGSSPSDAFFVKCDEETTTQGDIDLGIVNVMVGFAPLKPAEFVVVRISQKAGQA